MTTLAHQDAPRAARRAVAEHCALVTAGRVCADSAALLTSEVVTNAMLHGSGLVRFGVDGGPGHVRVEVADDDRRRPTVVTDDRVPVGGRGMALVDQLACDWGVIDTADGKLVWFQLDLQP